MKTFMRLLFVGGFVFAVLCSNALGQVMLPRPPSDQAEDLPPLEVRYQRVNVSIENQIASVHIRQSFINHTDQELEAVFLFPLPESANISDFAYWVGNERIAGEIREKQEAAAEYESQVAMRRDPAILEQIERNLFRARVFPIPAGGETPVELDYTQLLPYDNGQVEFLYPLTVSDIKQKLFELTVTVTLKDLKQIVDVQAPDYPASVRQVDDRDYQISMEKYDFTPDKDFKVQYRVSSDEFGIRFLTNRTDQDNGYFMLMVAPMEKTTEENVIDKDIVFVFDKSGSMDGPKIDQAKAALEFCIKRLGKGDRFSLVVFSDVIDVFSDKLLPADKTNIDKAVAFVKKLTADGATDIHGALVKALGIMKRDPARQSTIIFLTDGLPTAGIQEIGEIIKGVNGANKTDTRVFTFGVGDDVDDYLLLKLAQSNRGAETHVRTNESIEAKVSKFYEKISTPVLMNLAMDFGKVPTRMIYPAIIPDVFKGTQLIVTGRYETSGPTLLQVNGTIRGKPWHYQENVVFPDREDSNSFLPRLWAQDRVKYLLDMIRLNGENAELKDEIIRLSKTYRFVTPYTSFLAVPKPSQLAMNQPGFAAGGDPLILVTAPANARSVVAVFPWGETRKLRYDAGEDRWAARFIIPAGTRHGVYSVIVIITLEDGTKRRMLISYQADGLAPSGLGAGAARAVPGGWEITLRVEASSDAIRAAAILPGGVLRDLDRSEGGGIFTGTFRIPAKSAKNGVITIPVQIIDGAHNVFGIDMEIEVGP